eukprot:8689091-Pyramimonas_sp.AAC.1
MNPFCEVAPQKQIEDKAVGEITEKFPNVKLNPVYKTDIESACDAAVAKCPNELKTLASPTSIEKLICEAALQNQTEDKTVEEIRQVSGAKVPLESTTAGGTVASLTPEANSIFTVHAVSVLSLAVVCKTVLEKERIH